MNQNIFDRRWQDQNKEIERDLFNQFKVSIVKDIVHIHDTTGKILCNLTQR